MAPSSSPSMSQDGKKQQTISSFFKKPASVGPRTNVKDRNTPSQKDTSSNISQKSMESSLTEDASDLFIPEDNVLPSSNDNVPGLSKATTSRSSKRDLGDDDEDEADILPDTKRLRKTVDDAEDEPSMDTDEPVTDGRSSNTHSRLAKTAPSKPALSSRTSKFLFSQHSSQMERNPDEDDEQSRKHREKMHKKFVQKLGRPDSLIDIKRRNHFISEETEDTNLEEQDEDEEEETPKPKAKRGAATKKSSAKLTPMEKQFLDIKRKQLYTLLVVEVGYKFRFFGEDARIAAKELGIVCIPGKMRYDEHPSEAVSYTHLTLPTKRIV